jgi:hypothetical protein
MNHKDLKTLLWNQYAENIFNSALFQMDYKYDLNSNSKLLGFQTVIYQNADFGGMKILAKPIF